MTLSRSLPLLVFLLLTLCLPGRSFRLYRSSFEFNSFLKSQPRGLAASSSDGEASVAKRIAYASHLQTRKSLKYQVLCAPPFVPLAEELCSKDPQRFTYHPISYGKFPDGTDDITISGFTPYNLISGEHVLFLASFDDNDTTLSQFQVLIVLLQSFIRSLTVVLPFSPVGTMERVTREGTVATANTHAHLFSSLPNCGQPTRLMVYDLHTLQNRFYLHGNAIASLHTSIPLLKRRMVEGGEVDAVAFPDDGAAKRFANSFADLDLPIIVCGKTRGSGDMADKRVVKIQEGEAEGMNIVIVDDLVQTGGTLYECGRVLKEAGAKTVSAFVAHAVFPNDSYKRFDRGGDRCCFEKFWVTNSIPRVTDKLDEGNGIFEVLDLRDAIVTDLDEYSTM
mmetsp:Transcript_17403/g.34950  ORF Transcript_17403/g.34950 Transcript_17403/m.34950 type:complete len:393 (-) Transcript_17403:37-1215(-)